MGHPGQPPTVPYRTTASALANPVTAIYHPPSHPSTTGARTKAHQGGGVGANEAHERGVGATEVRGEPDLRLV